MINIQKSVVEKINLIEEGKQKKKKKKKQVLMKLLSAMKLLITVQKP